MHHSNTHALSLVSDGIKHVLISEFYFLVTFKKLHLVLAYPMIHAILKNMKFALGGVCA